MTIIECYLLALQGSEENLTNGGIKIDPARFIQLFNKCQNDILDYYYQKKNNDDIRKIEQFLVREKKLSSNGSTINQRLYSLPADYFRFSNLQARFRRGDCTVSDFTLWEVKNEDYHELLKDFSNKPDFDYRETFYTIGQKQVGIFVDGFVVDSAYLTYYREPIKVDMKGYMKTTGGIDDGTGEIEGEESTNINPEWNDHMCGEIIEMVVKQYYLNDNEYYRYAIDKDNVMNPK